MSYSFLCQVFYLHFSKTMILNCSSFAYYSWKSLFLIQTYGIKSLSQQFEKEIYQYVNIMWLLLTGKHLCWSLFLILSIAKFLREPVLKNICEQLLLKMSSWNWGKLKFIHKDF